MDTEVTIFLASAGLSFGPIYLVLKAIDKRRGVRLQRRGKQAMAAPTVRQEFVTLLRREAADRAANALAGAFLEARATTSNNIPFQLSAEARQSLADGHRLVDCLLPGEARSAFERAAVLVARPLTGDIRQVSTQIEGAIGMLSASVITSGPLTPPKFSAIPAAITRVSKLFFWAIRPREFSKRNQIDDKQ